jgi:hypothetical protein
VTAVFDTQFILAGTETPSQDPDNPTPAPEAGVFLIAAGAIGPVARQGLVLPARPRDHLAWRSQSLSGDADQSVVIYRIGAATSGSIGGHVIGHARAETTQTLQPIPDSQTPTEYASERQYDYRLTTPVTHLGEQVTRLDFYIVNRVHSTLTTVGYLSWDALLVLVPAGKAPGAPAD